jgi:hypothetical protein
VADDKRAADVGSRIDVRQRIVIEPVREAVVLYVRLQPPRVPDVGHVRLIA